MHKGDTCKIILNYMFNGHDIKEGEMEEIELQLGKDHLPGSLKLLLSEGRIYWDEESEKYTAIITQDETFKLPTMLVKMPNSTASRPKVPYQVRFFLDDCCVGDDIGYLSFKNTLSGKVLGIDDE